ncbi:hypothetical protein TNCV_1105041 [Trichonephila clavipes]|nr:hypothetical protein TNCV_1105041 [Trichonephila clavipes]
MPMQLQHRPQLINRSDWRKVTSDEPVTWQPWNRGFLLLVDLVCMCRFIVDHPIADSPVCDAALRVAAAMVSELRVHATANVVELSCRYLLSCKRSQFLTQGSSRSCTIH